MLEKEKGYTRYSDNMEERQAIYLRRGSDEERRRRVVLDDARRVGVYVDRYSRQGSMNLF